MKKLLLAFGCLIALAFTASCTTDSVENSTAVEKANTKAVNAIGDESNPPPKP